MKEHNTKFCFIGATIQQKKAEHKKEYVVSLSDKQIREMSMDEEVAMMTPKEREWQESHTIEYGQHIKNCKHPICHHVLNVWRQFNLGKYYIQ